ncbi:MAG: PIN domain-containing protein [Deltaproteobacteria bacterium]|nr:PIN domain-containing protein [Deltaproteobacteria bacterium]
MIAIDTNVLVYAHRAESPWHTVARDSVARASLGRWAIPWPCVHEFLSVVTHPKIFDPPTPLDDALRAVESWVASPNLTLLGEDEEAHWPILARLARAARISGPRVHDARIAAICVGHGVHELWTADRDFSRFPSLVTRNPLVPSTT